MMNLVLIRGNEHGLLPVRLLSEIAGPGINIRTRAGQELPGPEELVLVDFPDPQDSVACIRRLREAGCICPVMLVAPEEQLPPFRELAPLRIASFIPVPVQQAAAAAALQQAAEQVQMFRHRYVPRTDYTRLKASLNRMRMSRLYEQVSSGDVQCLESLEAFNSAFGTEFAPGPLACLGVQVDTEKRDSVPSWSLLEEAMAGFAAARNLYAVQLRLAGFGGCLFSVGSLSLQTLAEEFYDAMRGACLPGEHVTVSLAGPAADITGLPQLFQHTVDGLRNRISLGVDRVIDIRAWKMADFPVSRILSSDRMIALCASLDVGDLDSVERQIEEAVTALGQVPRVSAQSIYMTAMRFYETFRDSRLHGPEGGNSDIEFFHQLDTCWSLDMLQAVLRQYCRTMMNSGSDALTGGPVSQSLRYINENLSAPLSLQSIARQAGLSPSYYGTLFKQQMGCTFIEYIQSRRISAATRLLVETGDTVAEIARQVGFSDYRYFSRLFTRMTGMTPTHYRRQHREQV